MSLLPIVIVTRHPALVQLLREDYPEVIQPPGHPEPELLPHVVFPEQIRGRQVVGVLPLHLAALALCVVEVPLALQLEDRGTELSVERLREIAGKPTCYVVRTGGTWAALMRCAP